MPGGGHSPEYDFDETKPEGTTYIADGDNWNVSNQMHFDNAYAVEHYSPSDDPDASEDDFGRHNFITLKSQATKPDLSGCTDRSEIHTGSTALYFQEPDGTQVILYDFTTGKSGLMPSAYSIPSGEKILFYKNTAVTGYSLVTSINDCVVYVGSGSEIGGWAGGIEYPGSTWTQPNHTHSFSATTSTPSGSPQDQGDGTKVCAVSNHTHTVSGTSGNGATANTWRPAGVIFTLQQRS